MSTKGGFRIVAPHDFYIYDDKDVAQLKENKGDHFHNKNLKTIHIVNPSFSWSDHVSKVTIDTNIPDLEGVSQFIIEKDVNLHNLTLEGLEGLMHIDLLAGSKVNTLDLSTLDELEKIELKGGATISNLILNKNIKGNVLIYAKNGLITNVTYGAQTTDQNISGQIIQVNNIKWK